MDDFLKTMDRVEDALERKELLKSMRDVVNAEAKRVKKAVQSDLAAALPALGRRVNKAVTIRRPKGSKGDAPQLLGWSVGVECNGKGGAVMTSRGGFQPLLPLPYWYEHGFSGNRHTKVGLHALRKAHYTGPATDVKGVHAVNRHKGDVAGMDARVTKAIAERLDKLFGNS